MEMPVQEGGDQGRPITLSKPDSVSAKTFLALADRLSPMVTSEA